MTSLWWSIPLGVSLSAQPPDPDADQAREWVNQELAKPEYGTELSWLTRQLRAVVQWFLDLLNNPGSPDSLRGLLILGIIVAVLVVLGVVVWRNPITRRARSLAIFAEDTSLADAQAQADQARKVGDWAQAFIWTFRTLVLAMAQQEICSAGPGVTAHEASRAISAALGFSSELSEVAEHFDQVRYGKGIPDVTDVDQLAALSTVLQAAVGQARNLEDNAAANTMASMAPLSAVSNDAPRSNPGSAHTRMQGSDSTSAAGDRS